MSLSRLWQRQGKRAEPASCWQALYGWFTEGFRHPGSAGGESAAPTAWRESR